MKNRLWKTSRGGFLPSASRAVLRGAEGWGCSMVWLQEQGPLHLKQDRGSDQRALFDPTVPTRRKHPQLVHPETPQTRKDLSTIQTLYIQTTVPSGMGPVWAPAPRSGALALVLIMLPCPFLSLQHPQGSGFSPI